MKRLVREDICLGKALPCSVYDQRGNLLLRKGVVVSYEEQLLKLLERGMYAGEAEPGTTEELTLRAEPSVYQRVGAATLRLKALLIDLTSTNPSVDVSERIRVLAQDMQRAVRQDPDAALAAVHMDSHNIYLLAHMVHAAVLSALLAQRLGLTQKETLTLMCGALTYDVGMLKLLYMEKQLGPLSEQQRDELAQHPERSRNILSRAGITDTQWLDLAQDHHERLNSHGYPRGLSGQDIEPLVGILAVIDVYLAMVKPRPWREALIPLAALKEINTLGKDALPAKACAALIKEMGMYPPGSIVRLLNDEIAVVTQRGAEINKPVVYSIYERSGIPRMSPQLRDVLDPAHAVKAALSHTECRSAALILPRLWNRH